MQLSKGWLLILGFVGGLWLGCQQDVAPELRAFFASLRSGGGTLLETAGQAGQDTGQFIKE